MFSTRLLLLVALAAGHASHLSAQTRQHPDYVSGYQAWSEAQWPLASDRLTRYWRDVAYSKTYDVAFWLGTSWCRQAGAERVGADLLDWSYHYHSMPERERPKFREERDLCIQWLAPGHPVRRKPLLVAIAAWGNGNATMRAEGKTYYIGHRDKGGLSAYPVRLKRSLAESEFAQRLVPLGQADAIAGAVRRNAPGFRVHVGQRFALASLSPGHDAAALRQIDAQLERYADFVARAYGLPLPEHYITVYLFPSIPDLRKWADRLHGFDASPMTLGYSLQNDLSVLAMVSTTQPGTVLHEVFHLIVRGSYGNVPQWLDEGIASLYETASVAGQDYFGEPNWRSAVFMAFSGHFRHIGLREVIQSPWFSDEPRLNVQPGEQAFSPDQQAFMLAYARMFVLYLQEHGWLQPVFNAFRQREPPAEYVAAPLQAIRLVATTMGKPIEAIEKDFRAWMPAAADPNQRLRHSLASGKEVPVEAVTREAPKNFLDRE